MNFSQSRIVEHPVSGNGDEENPIPNSLHLITRRKSMINKEQATLVAGGIIPSQTATFARNLLVDHFVLIHSAVSSGRVFHLPET